MMDAVPFDDLSWSRMQYLRDKEVRAREAGKGFRMQVFDGSEIAIGTLTRLHKRRSTDPFFAHPEDPGPVASVDGKRACPLQGGGDSRRSNAVQCAGLIQGIDQAGHLTGGW